MTPTAVTPAARATPTPRQRPTRTAAPPRPRRVSGPAAPPRRAPGDPTPSRAAQAPARPQRPATRPQRPATRSQRPATRPQRPAARPTTGPAPHAPLGARAVATLRTLPDHSLLDRIVRGRLWIPLLGVLLVGIVAMQVEVLKLNASIGHAMVRTSQLQTENQLLRGSVSQLSDDQRIETRAADMGMTMPAPYLPQFLSERSTDVSQALTNIKAPDATAFGARLAQTAAARAAEIQSTSGQ